jgi:hypothetical protein
VRKVIVLVGAILIIAAGVWQFGLRDQFNRRFPDGWRWQVDTIGQTSRADESGAFPEGTTLRDDPINVTERRVSAVADPARPNVVNISDFYEVRNPATNSIDWQFTYEAQVNSFTGRHINPEFANDYYFFPTNTQKTTYTVRNTSFLGIPMSFQNEEVVAGILTYKFAFSGAIDSSHTYPDIVIEENQRIYCLDFELEYWVEPNTGEIVKYREWCEGDLVVDAETLEPIYAVTRWGSENTGDDLIRRSAEVQSAVTQYQLVNVIVPLGLLIAGLGLLIVGLLPLIITNMNAAASRT